VEIHVLKEEWDADDHNVGSFIVLPDNRLMVFYARHNKPGLFCRTASRPEDIHRWNDEVTVSGSPRITYNHPVYLKKEKTFYVFWRGPTWKPTFSTSRDGVNWGEPRILIRSRRWFRPAYVRPYVKVATDGESSIHFAFTDGHPKNEWRNSLYYLRYEGGRFFRADGVPVGRMDTLPVRHDQSDVVYNARATGVRAWVWDIALDDRGFPVIAYVRFPSQEDHRYHYARWTGADWLDTEVVAGGTGFPEIPPGKKDTQQHYSGGIALDPENPSVLFVSRQVNGAFEIEKWETPDRGKSWQSVSLTRDSRHLNVRPLVPRGHPGGTHVLWMFGRYERYTDYRTGVRMFRDAEQEESGSARLRGEGL